MFWTKLDGVPKLHGWNDLGEREDIVNMKTVMLVEPSRAQEQGTLEGGEEP